MLLGVYGGLNSSRAYGGINAQKCMMAAIFPKCIFPKCIFCKVFPTRLSFKLCEFIRGHFSCYQWLTMQKSLQQKVLLMLIYVAEMPPE